MRRSLFLFLCGVTFLFGDGCGTVTNQPDGGGSGGHAGGRGGSAAAAGSSPGGSGGGQAGATAGSTGHGGVAGSAEGAGAGGHPAGGLGGGQAGAPAGQGGSTAGQGGLRGGAGQGGQGGVAGQSGTGGGPTDGGVTCAELVSDFAAALIKARACNPGATKQCTELAPVALTNCPGCDQYVNDSATLIAIQKQWFAQCRPGGILCPAISCVALGPSSCVANSPPTAGPNAGASTGGTCTNSSLLPP